MASKKSYLTLQVQTKGEKFYHISSLIEKELENYFKENNELDKNGILHLFCPHTSAALTISESYDPSAKEDLESFFKHLVPLNFPFITHTMEGKDDSPSHMKSILLNQSLSIIIDDGKMILGTWQGIYLAEFRHSAHNRKIYLKFSPDN